MNRQMIRFLVAKALPFKNRNDHTVSSKDDNRHHNPIEEKIRKFFLENFRNLSHHPMFISAASNADSTSTGVTQHSMAAAIAIRKKITSPIFQVRPRMKRQISPG